MVEINLVNLGIAYAAGFLSFFAGCVAPVAPVYVSFLAGAMDGERRSKFRSTLNGIIFTFGFLSIFVILGVGVNSFSRSLAVYGNLIDQIGGLVLIVMGLILGEFVKINSLVRTYKINFDKKHGTLLGAFILGLTFGFAWTPCIGPVLSGILVWISLSSSFGAVFLLIVFSLGLGTPFLLLGLFFDLLWPYVRKITKYSQLLSRISGILMIIFGLVLVFGKFETVSSLFLSKLGSNIGVLEFRYK